MTEIRLPELGENVDSGDLIRILVSEGDTIKKDQGLLELETEKATIEVPSPAAGTVREIHVKEGDHLKVGQLLFTVETEGAERRESPTKEQPKAAEKSREEKPHTEEPPVEKPRKKEAQAEPARERRERPRPPAPPEGPKEKRVAKPTEVAEPAVEAPERARRPVPAAPSTRRLARELGIDIAEVAGSGPGGRISEDDVRDHARRQLAAAGPPRAAPPAELPDFSRWGEVERKPMNAVRRSAARNLAEAWRNVAQVTHFDRADITELEELRRRYAKQRSDGSAKITVTSVAVKVAASALKKFPKFGASVDMAAEQIIYKNYFHIGVAVDTDRGLLVPVIRDADGKTIPQIAADLEELSEKARNRRLAPDEVVGGVFTITNLGGIGGTGFSPIVNYPEAAILGIARASLEPRAIEGTFLPRLTLPLSLSYDHRLIDGAEAARFLRWIAEALEHPGLLLFEG